MAMTPEERASWLQGLGYPESVAWIPLPEEIDETSTVVQLQRVAAALRTLGDVPVGN